MTNLTTNHQVIIATILAVLVILFIKWLYTPSSNKNKTYSLPARPVVPVGGQMRVSDLLSPTHTSLNTDEVMFELNGVRFWIDNSDVQKVIDATREAGCELKDSGIDLYAMPNCLVDGSVKLNAGNSARIDLSTNVFVHGEVTTITHDELFAGKE